ncbi:unnamed protein product [Fusarium venenatum]|uniref:Uncharacterized protein n=1 Tax=Fusarium venenatum TaxID=56646 RepID=A0A2L2TU52_9HYPO|nr:uncharacterized protein FVRRES_00217 [Fusarium venenatum]CEI63705.1 unnamed protein product [Fusarium venenatum]
MVAIKCTIRFYAVLAFLFAFVVADDKSPVDEVYDPSAEYDPSNNYRPRNITGLGDFYSWVGSYYNATAEVELEFLFSWQYGGPLCPVWQNYTHTAKFDAVLSIIERGHWNAGNNSIIFWLTLLPQNSPSFNISSLTYEDMTNGKDFGISYPILSNSLYEHRYYRPENSRTSPPRYGSSLDLFDFTTSQMSDGAYNTSGTVLRQCDREGHISSFANFSSMPVCDSTTQTDDAGLWILNSPFWNTEGGDEFQYPHISIHFDDKTASLTLDASFHLEPYIHPNQTRRGPSAQGFLRVRFSGVLDEYHSDTLNLNGSTPTWLRTVGFSNDSSNIGYSETSESSAEKLNLGLAFTLIGITTFVMITIL